MAIPELVASNIISDFFKPPHVRDRKQSQGAAKTDDPVPDNRSTLTQTSLVKGTQAARNLAELNDPSQRSFGAGTLGLTKVWDGVRWVYRKPALQESLPRKEILHKPTRDVIPGDKDAVRAHVWGDRSLQTMKDIHDAKRSNYRHASTDLDPRFGGAFGAKKVPSSGKMIPREDGIGLGPAAARNVVDNRFLWHSQAKRNQRPTPVHFFMPSLHHKTYKYEKPQDRPGYYEVSLNRQAQATAQDLDVQLVSPYDFYTGRYTQANRFASDAITPVSHNRYAGGSNLARWIKGSLATSTASPASGAGKYAAAEAARKVKPHAA